MKIEIKQEDKQEDKQEKKLRARCIEIVQYECNPVTGEDLNFNEEVIKAGLSKRVNGLKRYAYVRHDSDVYVDGEHIPEGKAVGDVRPAHWHVLLEFTNTAYVESVADTFGVPMQYVEVKKGHGAFLDCVYYMTHESEKEQAKGKVVYDRDQVTLHGVTWEEVDTHLEYRFARSLQNGSEDFYVLQVAKGKMTLTQVFEENPVVYSSHKQKLQRAREQYLNVQPVPKLRQNYYITGGSGYGKTLTAKALAMSMFPGRNPSEVYFEVGEKQVAFDGYDGQPVLIWDDWRAEDFKMRFSHGDYWKIFDVNPSKSRYNVKYGKVVLNHVINIVTSVEPFERFVLSLAMRVLGRVDSFKEKEQAELRKAEHVIEHDGYFFSDTGEPTKQGYRRFPLFLEVSEDSLKMYASQYYKTGGAYDIYNPVMELLGKMKDIAHPLHYDKLDQWAKPMLEKGQTFMPTEVQVGDAVFTIKDVEDEHHTAPSDSEPPRDSVPERSEEGEQGV